MEHQPRYTRHELSVLQLRLERKIEAQLLDKLKKNIEAKLLTKSSDIIPNKQSIRVA